MDSSEYKDFRTTRGINYHYYFSPAKDVGITLLFCHGFPSTSYDWHHQVAFFQEKGYGLIVPDMLGYGGTDKPTTPESYKLKLLANDMAELVDAEKVHNVVAIGHDWGAKLASGLAVYHPSRFIAFGFLALAYMPPNPTFDVDAMIASDIKSLGYATIGYWKFFSEDDADKIIESHLDSFFSLSYPSDPKFWITDFGPVGKAKEWCLANRNEGYASYLSEKEKEILQKNVMEGGFAAPLCWYKVLTQYLNRADEASVPVERYTVHSPVFFGATLQDYICLAAPGKQTIQQFCPEATVVDFDTDHWVMHAEPEKLNRELLKWIGSLEIAEGKESLL